jgi:hypothetical protein
MAVDRWHWGWGGVLRVPRVPLPILTPLTAPHSLIMYHRHYIVSVLTVSLNNLLEIFFVTFRIYANVQVVFVDLASVFSARSNKYGKK